MRLACVPQPLTIEKHNVLVHDWVKGCRHSGMEGTRQAQDDAYWRLISIETPLLHTRRCRTDDLPDVTLRLRRSVQHYAKRTATSAVYRQ
jgi:hypothetical protein